MISEEELKRIKLFQSVDLESIRGLIDACTLRSLEKGEVLITAGQTNRTVYFLLSGRVTVHLDSLDSQPTAVLGPGESVAEMSVIDRRPASASVVAAEPTDLLAMDEDILWSLVQSSHAAACNLLMGLTSRLRHADEAITGGIETEQDYRRYGTLDALTGLHNRFWLERTLERQIERSVKGGEPLELAVIMIDIDYFKAFNEKYGRAYGDHILSFVAHTISDNLRPTEIITRYGGDEFVIFLPDVGSEPGRQICERIQREVMRAVPAMPDGKTSPHPTISLSMVMLQPGQTSRELLAEAERALARVRNSGRSCAAE
ncbi:MAG: GGDEF domain-containing protein [Syntrophales bacterium]